jgi:hypothetical protein
MWYRRSLIFNSLITEWRIQKRVEEQFNAFVTGFNELIPPDLVNVFDERELELLIGGIADIDVEDWKKHTDYRGYTEQDEVIRNFWTVSNTFGSIILYMLIFFHSVSGLGMRNKNHDCCNLPRVLLESLSMDSKIYKEAMDQGDSLLRNPDLIKPYRNHILGKLANCLSSSALY